jgi:hypothetical protein
VKSIGPTKILGVLRLRAVDPLSGDRSARRFAQDDGLVGGLKYIPVGCATNKKYQNVTTAQDDGLVGVLKKNVSNRLALMDAVLGLGCAGTTERVNRNMVQPSLRAFSSLDL